MKKILFCLSLIILAFLISCAQNQPIACTADAKICPDGESVGRIPPKCEFAECPKSDEKAIKEIVELCETENPRFNPNLECQKIIDQKYTKEKCTFKLGETKFLPLGSCRNCTIDCSRHTSENNPGEQKNYCTPKQKNAQVCSEIYAPVCGWFDSSRIQCIKYPCASTYSNSCFACQNLDVSYWTKGECPK